MTTWTEDSVATELLACEAERRDRDSFADDWPELVPLYDAAVQALPPLEEAARGLKSLAELAAGRGSNRLSMPLSTFVLAARLEVGR